MTMAKKVKIKEPVGAVPDFAYTVIREDDDTVTIGWQTRDWNERTLRRDEVVFVDEQ
jgi:restriction endonuclease